jgi:putative endonuclease
MPEPLSIISQNKRETVRRSSAFGTHGEMLAAEFIEREGYRIVMANFKAPIGRNSKGVQVTGEIDLIALDGETVCFIEVKTRRSEQRFDVVSVVMEKGLEPRVELTRGFWSEGKFKKPNWNHQIW